MSFLAPLAFLGGLIAIPIILFYMLRLRRQEAPVSSNFLWQQILQDHEANTPWQRLRRNLLLLLQLLILALLVLALARPFVIVPTVSAGKTVVLLDATASMNATDMNGASRFEVAKERAREMINTLGPADTLSFIRVADVVEQLTPYTGDANELRAALDAAQPGFGGGDWETALTLAAAGAAGAEDFNIVIIGDGGLGNTAPLPSNISDPLFTPVGESSANLAITALAPRALPGETPQLFAQVANFGPGDVPVSLVIKLDGVLRHSASETISARSQRSFVFALENEFRAIEAELIFSADEGADYLEIDNRAWATMGHGGARRVLLMSRDNNVFLEQVLRSLPELEILRGDPESDRLPEGTFDLYIFNGWLPGQLPDGDMLIMNPPRRASIFTVGDEIVETGNIIIAQPGDPRMAFVELDDMSLLSFRALSDIEWAETLIRADGGALLVAGENEGRQIVILPFDIRNSDLPLRIAWPVLIANLMDWFIPANTLNIPDNLAVGDPVIIRPPREATLARITLPDGSARELAIEEGVVVFAETALPGLYALDLWNGEERLQSQNFAINLFGIGESAIAPAGADVIQSGDAEGAADERKQHGLREFWHIIALLALAVLLIEWRVYHRRLQAPTILRPIRGSSRQAGRGFAR